ncbi:uncharacterized protein LOC144447685 [Glandiceps talaboti]
MAKDEQEVLRRFKQIQEKAASLGLTTRDVARLKSLKELQNNSKYSLLWFLRLSLIILVAIITVSSLTIAVVLKQELIDYETLAKTWFDYQELSISEETCIIENPEYVQDFFRPPIECSFCANVSNVKKVSGISVDEFTSKYAYSSLPVVIEDGSRGWTAPKTFSFDFFKTIYSPESDALERVDRDCQFFPYQTTFESLGEVFNMSTDRAELSEKADPWYIGWSNCDPGAANALRRHYNRPYFIPEESESSKTDWIFMGSPGYGAHMHIDAVGTSSWQAQIKGRKQWTLVPPPECYYECPGRMEVIVEPGEIIVVDTNKWYHATLIIGEDLSIAIGSEYD